MNQHKGGARAEQRRQDNQRVNESASLADRFRDLRTLTVDLAHYDPDGRAKTGEIKYTVNLANAKSMFRFSCPNEECVAGDFDLSQELANAIASRRTTASGEIICHGWRSKTTVDRIRC